MLEITKPTEEEFQALVAEHASRFPEKAAVNVVGDGGAAVRLPLVVGNPTPAKWAEILPVLLELRPPPDDFKDLVAQSALIWPDRKTWFSWLGRWPALAASVADVAVTKIGARLRPATYEDAAPEGLGAVLAERREAVFRTLQTRDGFFDIALVPPTPATWRMFREALNKPKADIASVVGDACKAWVVGCVQGGQPYPWETLVERRPLAIAPVITEISALAGATKDAQLGEW